ncbi:hypothetical protein BJ165DRAFT_1447764 [Panaeolus papilionaceus]|nr:hypothetical protein BJ165DRAFT_1447764 [Panaeolus papilionaceus]
MCHQPAVLIRQISVRIGKMKSHDTQLDFDKFKFKLNDNNTIFLFSHYYTFTVASLSSLIFAHCHTHHSPLPSSTLSRFPLG